MMQLTDLIPNISELIPHDYNQIASADYELLINTSLNGAPTVFSPCLYHMFGIPGAGKSTFYHYHTWEPHILIAFDDIMEKLPAYQKDLTMYGAVQAFKNWEITARIIGYELLLRAILERKNIFLDHGGASQAHYNLIKNLPSIGYRTEMYQIDCTINIALRRINARENIEQRHTPEIMVRQRAQACAILSKQYKRIANRFFIYDNSSDHFVLKEKIINPQTEKTTTD